jgi:CRISPR-associated endoribonuclease Cas6
LHDGLSLYSLGWFQGGGARNGALHFPHGATWFISAPDTSDGNRLLETIAASALRSPQVCNGMEVVEIYSQSTPEFGSPCIFKANSPIFIRGEKEGDKEPHILYDDPRADELMTRTLRHKLDKAGLGHLSETVNVCFDRTYKTPKVKLIQVKDSFHKRANVCPVIVEGDEEAVRFAWNCGVGNLTGSGFGSLV